MNKTIYLKDEDAPLWDRARELSGEKLSQVIVEGLKRFVSEHESRAKGFERIVVEYNDSLDNGLPKAKAFNGRWIIDREEPLKTLHDPDEGILAVTSVAESAKGNVVIYSYFESNGTWAHKLLVYPSFEKAAADPVVSYAACEAMRRRGVPVEELDI